MTIPPPASIIPERNVMDEMWPSPVARRLMMTRSEPSGTSLWSGWGTMLGLNSAAHSKEYSLVKYEPVRSLRFWESGRPMGRYISTRRNRSEKNDSISWWRPQKSRNTSSSSASTSASVSDRIRVRIFKTRGASIGFNACCSSAGKNGRMRTLRGSGLR